MFLPNSTTAVNAAVWVSVLRKGRKVTEPICLPSSADEFKVAVGNWMDGAVGGFADSQADWSYSVVNSCGANVPETPLSLSNAPEELGAESGESDFIGYQTVVLEDTTPSITTTQQTGVTCNLVISILFQDTVVRCSVWVSALPSEFFPAPVSEHVGLEP